MYYFPELRIGQFHIPKTAGQSLSHFLLGALGERGHEGVEVQRRRWHEPISVKREVLGADVFDASRFVATVRNPYATAVSLYFWNKLKVEQQHPDVGEGDYPSVELIAQMPFSEYMDWYIENETTFEDYLLLDGSLPSNVSVARLESVEADLERILNDEWALELDIELPKRGRSLHGPFMDYLSPSDIARLNEKQAWAFETFYPDARVEE